MNQFGNFVKQAQQMQTKIKEVQAALGDKIVEGSAGGGMVVAKVNGRQEVVSIHIEPEVLAENDQSMIQDLIVAAVNQGLKQATELMQDEMGKVTGSLGLNIPGLLGK